MKGLILRRVKSLIQRKPQAKHRMKKRKSCRNIFTIVKVFRRTINRNDHCDFSTTQTDLTEDTLPSQTGSSSQFDIEIPSFFNDFKPNPEIQTKLLQYEKLNHMFDDIEDRDIYLVRKDSLFC